MQSSYKKISGLKFSRAHVRIDEENPVVGKVPYVFGQTECGKPGQYMHLTTYLLFAGEFAGFGEIGKRIGGLVQICKHHACKKIIYSFFVICILDIGLRHMK